MAAEEIEFAFHRELDVSRRVVWDALADPDLVVGWLAEASIEPMVGGRYDLVWLTSTGYPSTLGTVVRWEEPEQLVVFTDNRGVIEYRLDDISSAGRLSRTRLAVTVRLVVEAAFAARVAADWLTNLDQLAELLRGHPVDWANWDRDHAAAWARHLHAVRVEH